VVSKGAPLAVAEVRRRLAALVGQKCWRVGKSYGDELKLDLGVKRPGRYYHERMFGVWRLGCRASPWRAERLQAPRVIATSRQPVEEALPRLSEFEGSEVSAVEVNGGNLQLEVHFTNGACLVVAPRILGGDLAHWEVFTPTQVIAAGPGRRFSVRTRGAPLPRSRTPG